MPNSTQDGEFPLNHMGKANVAELVRRVLKTEMKPDGSYDIQRVLTLVRAKVDQYPREKRMLVHEWQVYQQISRSINPEKARQAKERRKQRDEQKKATMNKPTPQPSQPAQPKRAEPISTEPDGAEVAAAYFIQQDLAKRFGSRSLLVAQLVLQFTEAFQPKKGGG